MRQAKAQARGAAPLEAVLETGVEDVSPAVALLAPRGLSTANFVNGKLALASLFLTWAATDSGMAVTPAEEPLVENATLVKLTRALRGKTLDALLQSLRGEPVLYPVYTAPPGVQQGGLWERLKRALRGE